LAIDGFKAIGYNQLIATQESTTMSTPKIFAAKGRIEQDGKVIGWLSDGALGGIGRSKIWHAKLEDGRTLRAYSRTELVAKIRAEWGFK
jgi:hypothetical protein